jgi:hypothetical protein
LLFEQGVWDSSRTGADAYVEYGAPVNILTGAAGCPEDHNAWQANSTAFPFSAVRYNESVR